MNLNTQLKNSLKSLTKQQLEAIKTDPEDYLMKLQDLKDLQASIESVVEKNKVECKETIQLVDLLRIKQNELLTIQNQCSSLYMAYQEHLVNYRELVETHSLTPILNKLALLEQESDSSSTELGKKEFSDTFIQEYRRSRELYYKRHLKAAYISY